MTRYGSPPNAMLKDISNAFVLANQTKGHNEGASAGKSLSKSRRVLVVDDNDDAAQSTAELLRLLGHEVFVANQGSTALAERARCHPDIVLLDISLPDMDGYEVARRMRTAPDQQSLVLVAMTGWGGEQDKQLADAAGFDLHWVKPVSLDKLQQISVMLPRSL